MATVWRTAGAVSNWVTAASPPRGSDTLLNGPLAGSQYNGSPPPTFTPQPANQQGGLDFNIIDLSYVSQPLAFRPGWDLRAGGGFRTMTLYFNSNVQAVNLPATAVGSPLTERETNSFYGFGGWGFFEVERQVLSLPGLSVFGRLEGMDIFSRITQSFTETLFAGPGAANPTASVRNYGGVGVSELRGILGLSYVVPSWHYSRFMLGYQYEAFFQIGRMTSFGPIVTVPDDRASLNLNGIYLRAEFNF